MGKPSLQGGFTLVEILMAIAISVLILGAASIFMYSSFTMLEQTQNDPGLEHHKLGVTGFLQYSFENALPDSAIPVSPNSTANSTANTTAGAAAGGNSISGAAAPAAASPAAGLGIGNTTTSRAGTSMAPTVNAENSATTNLLSSSTGGASSGGNSTSGNSSGGNSSASGADATASTDNAAAAIAKTTNVAWGWPPTVSVGEDPYLTWVMPSDSPLLIWENGPRPPIRCFLEYKDHEGLELIWVPPSTPNDIELNAVRRTLLSPLVVRMTYLYYDATGLKWDYSESPPKDPTTGSFILPDYIQLTFDLNGKLSTMNVAIPPADTSVPLY